MQDFARVPSSTLRVLANPRHAVSWLKIQSNEEFQNCCRFLPRITFNVILMFVETVPANKNKYDEMFVF